MNLAGSSPPLARRLATYFTVMFPAQVFVPSVVLTFASYSFMLQATASNVRPTLLPGTLFALCGMLLVFLLLRLFDELKDQEVEPRYFPDRPLVTGAVRYDDVKGLAIVALLAVTALNLGRGPATSVMLVLLVWLVLSWQWWFFPQIVSPSFVLVFLSTATVMPLVLTYVYAAHLHAMSAEPDFGRAALLVFVYWVPFFSWEVSRKIRAPEDETVYPTYSQRWGPRAAAGVLFGLLLAGGSAMIAAVLRYGLPTGLAIYHAVLTVAALIPVARFAALPSRARARLRLVVEAHTVLFHAGTIAWLFISRIGQ